MVRLTATRRAVCLQDPAHRKIANLAAAAARAARIWRFYSRRGGPSLLASDATASLAALE